MNSEETQKISPSPSTEFRRNVQVQGNKSTSLPENARAASSSGGGGSSSASAVLTSKAPGNSQKKETKRVKSEFELLMKKMFDNDSIETLPAHILNHPGYKAPELTGNEEICPECTKNSMKILRSIVPGDGEELLCFGIPTCMNEMCMFISNKITTLPLPPILPKDFDMPKLIQGADFDHPLRDPVLRKFLKDMRDLKGKKGRDKDILKLKEIVELASFTEDELNIVMEHMFPDGISKLPK